MEEGIANVVGMGGIKAVGGAAKQSISKLKPLIEEAKKYKSAEEFVKSSNKTRLQICSSAWVIRQYYSG